ncbi:MAG: nitrogen fixation protein NifQ, partial [Bradyrhizobiaceae bacterium]|nr:nitrogen fixation protein NifQ [Bradyrhizobiaceae bacterium]
AAGAAVYRLLTGCDPADAAIEDDTGFDRHVLAAILAVAATEGGTVAERTGLGNDDLLKLIEQQFPHARAIAASWYAPVARPDDEETAMVRDLLIANRTTESDISRWLSAMVARRAMEPNHLWEDLGLRDRDELTRLLDRHFAPIACRNTKNMKWKRFFYRSMCEDDGFVMCSTPVCTQCADFDRCYGDETGESRLAQRRRDMALNAMAQNGDSPPST